MRRGHGRAILKAGRIHAPAAPGCHKGLLMSRVLILMVYAYRVTLGPVLGGHCRFQPTCSQYMIDAVNRHGPWRGLWRGLKRIGKCHPLGGSGYDPA